MTENSVRYSQMCRLADGSDFGLHIHEFIGGAGDGPTLGICGLIHGNEVVGAYIACDLARKLREMSFKGRVLMLPVANPHGFAENERFTTIDRINLNRVFPGDPAGTFAQKLAHHITEEFFTGLDAFVDLHTGTDRPTVEYTYVLNDEGLSRASGSKFLYRTTDEFIGTSTCTTTRMDILSVVIEIGGGTVDQAPYVERGVDAVLNMMRYMEMSDEPVVERPDQTILTDIKLVFPTQGGVLETEAPPLGGNIKGGDVLGRVISPYTFEELEVMFSPVENGVMILSHLVRNVVQPGDYAYMVGDLDSREL